MTEHGPKPAPAGRRPTRWRRLAGPLGAAALMLAVLLGLGTWQLHRRAWKHRLLAQIEAAESRPPPFTRVVAEGRLRPEAALYGTAVRDEGMRPVLGAYRVQVLDRGALPPLLVDLGWVPEEGTAPPVAAGPARIVGYVRPPDRASWLSAPDDPARRRFFTLDPQAIGASLGAPDPAAFTLVALGSPTPGAPLPAESLPRPPDNHLQYALTWFGLAAVLVGVTASWVGREWRDRGKED
jgi:surfeit locus 1 family protein